MAKKTLNDMIYALEAAHLKEINSLAEQIRQKYVIPFCNKKNLRFTSGMGSFSFHKTNGDIVDVEWHGGLPKKLNDMLCESVMFGRQDIGSFMYDYESPGYTERKNKQ